MGVIPVQRVAMFLAAANERDAETITATGLALRAWWTMYVLRLVVWPAIAIVRGRLWAIDQLVLMAIAMNAQDRRQAKEASNE